MDNPCDSEVTGKMLFEDSGGPGEVRRSQDSQKLDVKSFEAKNTFVRRSESLKVRRHGHVSVPLITLQGADDSKSEIELVGHVMKSESLDTGLEKKFKSDPEFHFVVSPKKLVSLTKNTFVWNSGKRSKAMMAEGESNGFYHGSDKKASRTNVINGAKDNDNDSGQAVERKSSVPRVRKTSLQTQRAVRRLSPVPNNIPSPAERKESLTKLMDTGRRRRDSIAEMPSAAALNKSNTKHRRVSLAPTPTIPRRRSSIKDTLSSYVGHDGTESIHTRRMRDHLTRNFIPLGLNEDDVKTVKIEKKTIEVTLPVYIVSQNENQVSITDLKTIEGAIHRHHPEVTVLKTEDQNGKSEQALRSRSDTPDKIEKFKGNSLIEIKDESGKDRTKSDMSAGSAGKSEEKSSNTGLTVINEVDMDRTSTKPGTDKSTLDRKISIRTCVRTMREDTEDYANQLLGCKNLGTYASMETLPVLLSKQDAVRCVVNAMNTFRDKEELQHNACASLLEMASTSETNCFIIMENGGIPALMNCIKCYSEKVPLIRIILNIIGYMSSNEELAETLLEYGCHSRVLSAIPQHSDDTSIVKQCLFILGNLVTTAETAQQIMLVGGVHTIIDMMNKFPHDDDILENGCRALGSFSVFDDTCLDVAQAGATKSVLLAMATSPKHVSVQECGLWALACLTTMADTCEELEDQDGLEIVLGTLERHPREEGVQEYGVRTICNLASLDTTLHAVCTEQVLAILQKVIQEFPESVQLQGHVIFAISQLTRGGDGVQKRILKNGGVKSVVSTMTLHPEDIPIQEHGCKILGNLAVNGDIRRQTEDEGASRVVIGAMLTLDTCEDIQEFGCMALMNITADSMENKVRVTHNGGVQALLTCLTNFQSRPNIVLSSLKTLGNIIELDEVCRLVMDERGLSTIVAISKKMRSYPDVEMFAAMVLCGLSGIKNLSIENIELIDTTVTAMLSLPTMNPDLTLFVCVTLQNILKTECGMHVFIAEKKLRVILTTMERYRDHPEILQCCCKMIAMLALDERHEMPSEAVRSVVASMNAFTNNKDLQIVGCGALACLCENDLMLTSCAVDENAVGVISDALQQHPEDHRLFAVALMAITNLLSYDATSSSLPTIQGLIFTAMTRFSENQEIQMCGCNAIARCRPEDGKTSESLFEVLRAIAKRHGSKDPIHRPFAKALLSFWKAGYKDQITKILETNPAFQDVFSVELQEARKEDK